MTVRSTDIEGVFILYPRSFRDHRGTFVKLLGSAELEPIIGHRRVRQINRSVTSGAGVVRGLHFQMPPHAEMKIITCLKGRFFDVALDLRKGSPTFRRWVSAELSAENGAVMVIPEGFAHGQQAQEPDSELLYIHTADYVPSAEAGVRYDDPLADVRWPLPPSGLSDRDRAFPLLEPDFDGITLQVEPCL